jgi:hypothetical protein
MITKNEQDFYNLKELSEKTNLSYKSVSIKLKRRLIDFDFIHDRKKHYHSSCIDMLNCKLKTYKTVYEKIYITTTYHIYPSKMNYINDL